MNARDQILGGVRSAIDGVRSPVHVARDYRDKSSSPASVVDLFVERVRDYKAVVVRCSEAELSARVTDLLAGRRVVVAEGLEWEIQGIFDDELSHEDLDAVDGVVTAARVAIATTGTIVLDHGKGQGRRALSLIPDLHACIVRSAQIVADVPDAVALLDPRRPQTWISGPSATSDIELNRVEGVHGPRTLHVFVVES